jgi:uncharacterized heparinase superfamily protein
LAWEHASDPERAGDFVPPKGSLAFADAGLYVLTSNRGTSEELFCLADAGPLGFLSIAAHGHADALSFTLSVGGQPVIVDPGTFSYFLDAHWREYFRSTPAHNTITIGGDNQSVSGGPFIWMGKAEVQVRDWSVRPDGALLTAEHSGYTRMARGLVHRRTVDLKNNRLDVIDRIEGTGRHDIEWRLHFHPACEVTLTRESCNVTWATGKLVIGLDDRLTWTLARGTENAGWYSRGFNLKEPTTTLIGSASIAAPIELVHRIDSIRPS